MVTIDQIQNGVASYLDTELMPKLSDNKLQKVLTGTMIGIAISKSGDIIRSYKDNAVVKMLGIIDENCNVDIDVLKNELLKQMGNDGVPVDLPMVGTMTFNKSDIEKIYKYIVGGVK
jgi:hypothetical protein